VAVSGVGGGSRSRSVRFTDVAGPLPVAAPTYWGLSLCDSSCVTAVTDYDSVTNQPERNMNIIKTVGDLRKALSAYDDSLPLEFSVYVDGVGACALSLNNDTQICRHIDSDGSVNGALAAVNNKANGKLQVTFMERP
jgi:hypothetical protein